MMTAKDKLDMSGVDLAHCLEHAREAALGAWQAVRHFYRGNFKVFEKAGEGPATEADVMADRYIVAALEREFPRSDFGYLSEEQARDADRLSRAYCWIIDPIDGTKDFIQGGQDFAVQIGLAGPVEGAAGATALVGVVYQPALGLVYTAMRGGGAWVDDLMDGSRKALLVEPRGGVAQSRLVVTSSSLSNRLRKAIGVLGIDDVYQKGSLGLKIVEVSAGRACLFLNMGRRKCREWDVCAPHAILAEAGGRLTDLLGNEIEYIRADIDIVEGLVASNGVIHDDVLRQLQGSAELW